MKHDYPDIHGLTDEDPIWYDEGGVPRYVAFFPDLCPSVYARWVVLLRIACSGCDQQFLVEMHGGGAFGWSPDRFGELHYGDPPRHPGPHDHGCVGDTMNCDDLEVVEVWGKSDKNLEWERHPEHEGPIE